MPRPVSGRQKRVSSAAIARSHSSAISSPPPTVKPWTAAMVGIGRQRSRPHTSRRKRTHRATTGEGAWPNSLHVAAGGKRRTRARQHHRTNLGVVDGPRSERFEETVAHRDVVSIEPVGAVERDPCDAATLFEKHSAIAGGSVAARRLVAGGHVRIWTSWIKARKSRCSGTHGFREAYRLKHRGSNRNLVRIREQLAISLGRRLRVHVINRRP